MTMPPRAGCDLADARLERERLAGERSVLRRPRPRVRNSALPSGRIVIVSSLPFAPFWPWNVPDGPVCRRCRRGIAGMGHTRNCRNRAAADRTRPGRDRRSRNAPSPEPACAAAAPRREPLNSAVDNKQRERRAGSDRCMAGLRSSVGVRVGAALVSARSAELGERALVRGKRIVAEAREHDALERRHSGCARAQPRALRSRRRARADSRRRRS